MMSFKTKVAESATFMVLFNLAIKAVYVFLLGPLGIYFLNEKAADWILIINLFSLMLLLDLGISAVSSRYITQSVSSSYKPECLVDRIKNVYLNLSFVGALIVGSLLFYLVFAEKIQFNIYIAILIFIAVPLYLKNNYIYAFLIGAGLVAKVNLIQAMSGSIVLILVVLALISANIYLASIFMLCYPIVALIILKSKYYNSQLSIFINQANQQSPINSSASITSDIVKSSFGVLMTMVLYNSISYFYLGYFGSGKDVIAAVLLLQIIRGVASFSQAPFYSKLPDINKRFITKINFLEFSLKRLLLSILMYILMTFTVFILIFLFFEDLKFLPAQFKSFNHYFFIFLALSVLIERTLAMLLQIYTATGHVIWHIVNAAPLPMLFLLIYVFKNSLGVLVFPVAYFISLLFLQLPILAFYFCKNKELVHEFIKVYHERKNKTFSR